MGKVLGDALATVKGRRSGGGGQMGDARSTNKSETGPGLSSGKTAFVDGLRGVCRALFHHCVGAIGFVAPGVGDKLEQPGVSGAVVVLIGGGVVMLIGLMDMW